MEGINLFFLKNKFLFFFTPLFIFSSFFIYVANTSASTNLLTNGGAESGSLAGWTTIANGGDGWSVNFDNIVRNGSNSFQASYGLDRLSQTVDLYANGYSSSTIDTYQPPITFSLWTRTRSDQAGNYYLIFKLLKSDGTTVVDSYTIGSSGSLVFVATNTSWFEQTHTFSQYGVDVRYAYVEFGGRDHTFWAGNYGPHFDDASISVADIHSSSSAPVLSSGLIVPIQPVPHVLSDSPDSNGTFFRIDAQNIISNVSLAEQMVVSSNKDFENSSWVPYQTSYHYPVFEDTTVYIKFRSSNGGESQIYTLTIPGNNQKNTDVPLLIKPTEGLVPVISTPKVVFDRDLQRGDRGKDVYRLQELLRRLGFFKLSSSTGYYGNVTKQAVVKLQKYYQASLSDRFRLTSSGSVDSETRALLNYLIEQ